MEGLLNRVEVRIGWGDAKPQAASGGGSFLILVPERVVHRQRTLGQGAVDLAQKMPAHVVTGGLVKPVEQPTARGGFAQALVYIIAIREVMSDLGNWVNILAYAAGFASGNVVGIWFEERMAIGFGHVRIMSPRLGSQLTDRLREAGYGVTVVSGRGKDGMVDVLITTVNRRNLKAVSRLVEETDPGAFITVESVRLLRKGFF